jgi:hypothetical protein
MHAPRQTPQSFVLQSTAGHACEQVFSASSVARCASTRTPIIDSGHAGRHYLASRIFAGDGPHLRLLPPIPAFHAGTITISAALDIASLCSAKLRESGRFTDGQRHHKVAHVSSTPFVCQTRGWAGAISDF